MPLIFRTSRGRLQALLLLAVLAGMAALAGFAWDESPFLRLALATAQIQSELHRDLASAVRAVRSGETNAAWYLATLGFLYGVFHAIGPGHGKVVIATYMLTQESQMRRGIVLSMLSSLVQGIVAIAIVEVIVNVLGLSFRRAEATASGLETASSVLIAGLGALLMFTRLRRLWHRRASPAHHHDHEHHHEHQHDHGAHCGHSHGPDRAAMERPLSLRTLGGVILSIGIRPCSGALLVLLAAHALGMAWAGIATVLVMSLGTGLAISTLAALSVYASRLSLRLAATLPAEGSGLANLIDLAALVGGAVIFACGLLLIWGSFAVGAGSPI